MAVPAAAGASRAAAGRTAARRASTRGASARGAASGGSVALPPEPAPVDLTEYDTTPGGARRPRTSARTSEAATWTPERGAADGADEPVDQPAPEAAPARARRSGTAARGASWTADRVNKGVGGVGGGAVLGALGYVLALTFLRGGPEGLVAWLRAKFLNQVATAPRGGGGGGRQVQR